MDKLCDICNLRLATHTIKSIKNGEEVLQQICDYDYARLIGKEEYISPFESLFSGNKNDDYDSSLNETLKVLLPI